MKIRVISASALALLFFLASTPVQASLITNGSFEADGLVADGSPITGWVNTKPPGATTEVVTFFELEDRIGDKHPRSATDGDYFALLKSNGPGSKNILEQDITVSIGDTLTGDATFLDWEADLFTFKDIGRVDLFDGTTLIANLFYAEGVEGPVGSGTTPWTSFSHEFTSAGTFTIKAEIENGIGDDGGDSFLGLDNFAIESANMGAIPEPMSIVTFGGLFTAFGFAGWRRKRKEAAA